MGISAHFFPPSLQALDVRVCEIVMGIKAQIAANLSAQDKSVDTYRQYSFFNFFYFFCRLLQTRRRSIRVWNTYRYCTSFFFCRLQQSRRRRIMSVDTYRHYSFYHPLFFLFSLFFRARADCGGALLIRLRQFIFIFLYVHFFLISFGCTGMCRPRWGCWCG